MPSIKKSKKQHRKYYDDPIVVTAGDRVDWQPKESEWAGWVWCIHPISKKEGWVPENCLKIIESRADVLKDYSAVELNAELDEEFQIIKEESGWYWCQNIQGQQGWLPTELFSV